MANYNNYREDGRVWFDDQICEIADLIIGSQGVHFIYLKKRDRSWIYKIGDDDMKYALLQMSDIQLRLIEGLIFENKNVADIRRELNLSITDVRIQIREMRKTLIAVM